MGGLDDCASPPLKRLKLMPSSSEINSEGASSTIPPQEPPAAITMARGCVAVDGRDDGCDTSNVGPTGLIRRSELVRVITQALHALGYKKTASLLEDESGIPLQSQLVSDFRQQILDGKWDDVIANMRLLLPDPQSYNSAASLILQQKFFELLDKQDTMEALKTLRLEISPLRVKKERLHELATCLICPSRTESLIFGGKNKKSGGNPRERLLQELQGLLPPSVMIPEKRLEHLLEQALIVQRQSCIFHNSVDQSLSLYSDHQCGRDQIPSQTLQVLEVHENEVWFLQFSHDGKYLASASKDCTAIIWEVVGDSLVKLKYTLTGHRKPVSFIAWSPDDRMILTCGNEEVIKLWNVSSGECKHTFDKPKGDFTACAWFPDGKRFISGGGDKCIYIWDVDGIELDAWKGVQVPRINDLAVMADGNHMICICEKDIKIFNLETKQERMINEDQSITSLSVSKDGRFLLVNLVSQEIHLWDMDNNKLLFKYSGHRQTRYVIRSCFGGFNQAFVVSGSEDSQVYIWHRGNGEILEVLPGHSGTVNCVSWNPVNPYMFASASDDHTIRIWGVNKHTQRQKLENSSNGVIHLVNGGPIIPSN
eukprot:c19140_g1_i1 orf=398-2182(-)